MSAVPLSRITVRISAKSTFTTPGLIIIFEIPTTPCRSTSSATAKARDMGVFSGIISSSLSLDTTITVSTCSFNRAIASSACFIRRLPSNLNGLVTTPTVKAPLSFAISATTGAAPLPVPPPMPLVTKIISAPLTMAAISASLSSAANLPISGSPPAPNPRVTSIPMLRTLAPRAFERPRACASVLTAQYSTPKTSVSIIRSMALHPPPPTPIILITQGESPPSGIRELL
mmetsp:Transcript_41090/g.49390  ORF Transcript_41090/g.49390 Transcript_41090/m.49390 type:complete len:230 (-) Transcript_41090:226-915(-)